MSSDPSPKPRCAGHSSRTGLPCKLPPINGGTVCATHGGKAPQVRAAAERRLEEQRHELELQAAAERYGLAVSGTHPSAALQDALDRSRALVVHTSLRVSALTPDEPKWAEWADRYEKRLEWYSKIAKDCATLGIAAAHLDIVKREADQVEALMRAVLRRLGIDYDAPDTRVIVVQALDEMGDS